MLLASSCRARVSAASSSPSSRIAASELRTVSLCAARFSDDHERCEIEDRSVRIRQETPISGSTSKPLALANAAMDTGWSS